MSDGNTNCARDRNSMPCFEWPHGRRCALSLTYDDGLPVHHEYVAPSLNKAGILATFYPTITSDPLHHPEKWREIAAAGHELGNHSLFHPSRRTTGEGLERYIQPWMDLCLYTPDRLRQELEVANLVLRLIDGKTERTYGNTGCCTTIGRGDQETSMDPILEPLFVAARGPGTGRPADVRAGINLYQVGCCGIDGLNFEQIQENIQSAREMGGWVVLMIHGIGEETHPLHVDRAVHENLIRYLAKEQDDVWVDPFITVAKYVRERQTLDKERNGA
jgi:peptidoglycan/xylan/chitin deacetylase (PgdA/CDA1 family)